MCHLQCKSSFFIYAWLTAWTWDRAIWLAACVAEVKNGNLWCVLLVPHPEDRCIVVRWAGCLLAAAAAPTPSKPAEIWLCIVRSGSCLPRLLALVRAFLQLELWSCICTKHACWQVNASKRSCCWLWVNVSKQCLLASCLLFFGSVPQNSPRSLAQLNCSYSRAEQWMENNITYSLSGKCLFAEALSCQTHFSCWEYGWAVIDQVLWEDKNDQQQMNVDLKFNS